MQVPLKPVARKPGNRVERAWLLKQVSRARNKLQSPSCIHGQFFHGFAIQPEYLQIEAPDYEEAGCDHAAKGRAGKVGPTAPGHNGTHA